MISSTVIAAFADVSPEGGARVRAARAEDTERVKRMLAVGTSDWADEDIDLVMSRAQTTLGGPETFKWILPAWLERSSARPDGGWITVSEVLADKLDRAGFDDWPRGQRDVVLPMLAEWLTAQKAACGDEVAGYDPDQDAVLRQWIEARSV